MKQYKLYIDDLRIPSLQEMELYNYIIVRTSQEAIDYITENGIPTFISFDHDLGGDDTAMKVVDFIIESVLDDKLQMPAFFAFKIHSANPIGSDNIESKLKNFLVFLTEENKKPLFVQLKE